MNAVTKIASTLIVIVLVALVVWVNTQEGGNTISAPVVEKEAPTSQTPFEVTQPAAAVPDWQQHADTPVVTPDVEQTNVPREEEARGVGLTPMEQEEEDIAALLFQKEFERADALFESFKVKYPEAALTHRYVHLKAKVQELE